MDSSTPTVPEKYSTMKIAIFVVVIVCILVVIYYIYCYYSDDDEGFFSSRSDIQVKWNVEEMIEKIHNRQRINLSRLSKNSHYNF